ncbi:MAG TPA: fibronectin type III domain-containing protein [Deltaproteobacteria bacterium]|nr:fibronectin type III domain-containing protein [Deltaproteobacteria bacterium]
MFILPAPGSAATLHLSWRANSERDLAGYRIYCGTRSRTYGSPVVVGRVTACQLTGIASGKTYYVALTAYDTSGNESSFSPEVSVFVPARDGTAAAAVELISPLKGAYLSSPPKFSWKGSGVTMYKLYISPGGREYTRIYCGSAAACTISSSFWSMFVPSGSTLYWYVEGITVSGQVCPSTVSCFRKL